MIATSHLPPPISVPLRYKLHLAKCAEVGAWRAALSAYRSILIRSCGISGKGTHCEASSPSPIVYRHLLRAAKHSNPPRPRAALCVLREMRSRNEKPSVSHYNMVLSACARAAIAASAGTHALTDCPESSRAPQDRLFREDGRSQVESARASGGGSIVGAPRRRNGAEIDRDRHEVPRCDGYPGGCIDAFNCWDREVAVDGRLESRTGGDELRQPGAEGRNRRYVSGPLLSEAIFQVPEPLTSGDAWRLALHVVGDMRRHGVGPTDVTFETLVGACRGAGADTLCWRKARPGEAYRSSPAAIYSALREAGIPQEYCYRAGVENALRGRRCYPLYIMEVKRRYQGGSRTRRPLVRVS